MGKLAHLSRAWNSVKPRPPAALIGYWTPAIRSIGAASQIRTKNLEPGERSSHLYVTGNDRAIKRPIENVKGQSLDVVVMKRKQIIT